VALAIASWGYSERWKTNLRTPNDVLIEAERLKQKLRKAAARKATKKKSPRGKVRERAE